jgi:molecular chaperone DnaK
VKRINEPTAAALAYGLDKTKDDDRCTTSAAERSTFLLEVGEGVIEVKATSRRHPLGR